MVGELSDVDLLALDYDGKVKLLESVTRELLDLRLEFATITDHEMAHCNCRDQGRLGRRRPGGRRSRLAPC